MSGPLGNDQFSGKEPSLSDEERQETVRQNLRMGQSAYECGNYRQAIHCLEQARSSCKEASILGGEVKTWLVMAYEAMGQRQKAIALCRELGHHPDGETRKQGQRLLYILEAPSLARRSDWTVEIPDLTNLDESPSRNYQHPPSKPRVPRKPSPKPETKPIDPSQVNTEDSGFLWVALGAIALFVSLVFWLE